MRSAWKTGLLSVLGSAAMTLQAAGSTVSLNMPATTLNAPHVETGGSIVFSHREDSMATDLLSLEAADSASRVDAIIRRPVAQVPVEAIPAPTALTTGLMVLAGLAMVRGYRRLQRVM